MTQFDTKRLSVTLDEIAPDGSDVRILLGLKAGVMTHYTLAPGQVSTALRPLMAGSLDALVLRGLLL